MVLDGTWIANTNYRHQLSGMSWERANATIGGHNSIAALAQHIHYYINGLNRVFGGGSLDIHDQFSFAFPPIRSQQDWENFLERFWKDAELFAAQVEQIPATQLSGDFVDKKYGSYRRNIEAMIEHGYYHLGQIVLLNKLLAGEANPSLADAGS